MEVPTKDKIMCQPRDNMTLLFSKNGDMISMNKNKKETCSMVWNFFCLSYA
jgi:hypothetical protein